ncbi:MAG: DUF1761 domain-containing protein [Chitinophagaceae bacterium]|nr:DUF1761 domain-containing protein [Chitinophagaceae bacterium]
MNSLQNIHWLPVILGGLAYFMLGALWYSKLLFAPKWLVYTKIDPNDPNAKKGMAGMFIGSFILMTATSFAIAVLAYKLQTRGWMYGAKLGLFTGLFFGVTAIAISYLYEKRPLGLYLINGGYTVVGSMIAGIIICSM